mgnify:CR=1 FL=1
MKKLLMGMVAIFMGVMMVGAPAFAACSDDQKAKGCVDTAVLGEGGCSCKSGETAEKGEGIIHILQLVVEIMTIGIGVLGVLGITIVGVQYLTAGGSEEKTRKAKRRMFEIVIGLVAYVLIYALMQWLIPGFRPFS